MANKNYDVDSNGKPNEGHNEERQKYAEEPESM